MLGKDKQKMRVKKAKRKKIKIDGGDRYRVEDYKR